MMGENALSMLLVDDEKNILLALKRELHTWSRERGIDIEIALSAREGLEYLAEHANRTILIVSDLRMPEMKGSDFLLEVKRLYPDIISLLLTGYSETEEIVKAVSAGIFSYMLKPWETPYLLTEIQKAFDYYQLRRENRQNLLRMTEELKWAGELQRTILRPNLPASQRIEFRATYRPVPGLFCGGDYYDVISVGTDRYALLIGDVEGHGIRAAIVTGILKAVIYPEYIRSRITQPFSPTDFLSWLNERMQFEFRSTSPMLISFFAGFLDLQSMKLTYANAGHPHPFLLRDGEVMEALSAGPALGYSSKTVYAEHFAQLRKGDTLLLYTDGLTEAGDGVKLSDILRKVSPGPEYHRRLLDTVLSGANAGAFSDDVTIVTAKLS